jgi:hypothetical protein
MVLKPSAAVVLAVAVVTGAAVQAQWHGHRTEGIPRHPDGRPNLSAPLPRMADGRPDLSGLWLPLQPYVPNPKGEAIPGEVPFSEWGAAVFRERLESFARDDPSARCITGGVPRVDVIPYPFRIFDAPGRVVILYEIYNVWREIFTDGRALPKDPTPSWMGYSIGSWEGDTFVVRASGFNGKAWLNDDGWPTTELMQVTERFRRKDFGHMEIEITVDDPKAYTRPWAMIVPLAYYADTELMEYACNENNKYLDLLPPVVR